MASERQSLKEAQEQTKLLDRMDWKKRVKRALKLDTVRKDQTCAATPLKAKKKNLSSYSPTTGTCQISPFSSPTSHNAQNLRTHPSDVNPLGDSTKETNPESILSRRGQPPTEEDVFMELQSKVKSSLARFLEIRANLKSLQALEGSGELGNIIAASDLPCDLRAEVQKNQDLMSQAEELQLFKRNDGKLPARECIQPANSAMFLRSLLD